ncbi:MAG: STAS domain-containing protein [Trebonia sp.]
MYSTVLKIRECDGHLVATVRGELDLVDAAAVATALMAAADRQPRIVVDLARLQFIDARGIGALARAREHARRARGDLLLAAPRPQTARLLATAAMAYGFSVYASVAEAAGGFRALLSLTAPAASGPLAARSGELRVEAGHAGREPGQDLLADLVRDDLGVA